MRRLSLKCSCLGLAENKVDKVEISCMVQVEFLRVETTGIVVIANVVPKVEMCKGAVYYCIEEGQCQCYLRCNGQTVSFKPHRFVS